MKISVGVDLHKTQFTVCFLRKGHKREDIRIYPTTDVGYETFCEVLRKFKNKGYEVRVAVESTGNTRYFCNRVLQEGISVKVINTMKFKVVRESVKKTDKRDAITIAKFLEKDMLPESVLCSQKSEEIRRIIKSRSILVKALVSLKNQVHGLLLGYGIETKRGQLHSKKERQRILRGLEDHKNYGHAAMAIKPLFESIDQLSLEVKRLEKVLEELVAEDEDVKLLRTIPGVGLITAATIRAYTDDIKRYRNYKKYAAYAGLVPWVQNSNETIRHGHITKRGPSELRTAFVQMVMGMIRYSKQTSNYRIIVRYQNMKKQKGSGKSIIATARKLTTIVYAMLKSRQPFNPKKMLTMKEDNSANSQLALAG